MAHGEVKSPWAETGIKEAVRLEGDKEHGKIIGDAELAVARVSQNKKIDQAIW